MVPAFPTCWGVCLERGPGSALGVKSHREVLSEKLVGIQTLVSQSLRLGLQEGLLLPVSRDLEEGVIQKDGCVFPCGGFAVSMAWPGGLSPGAGKCRHVSRVGFLHTRGPVKFASWRCLQEQGAEGDAEQARSCSGPWRSP